MLRLWRRMSSSDESSKSTSSAPGTAAPSSTAPNSSDSPTLIAHPYCNSKRSHHPGWRHASQTTLPEAIAESPSDPPDTTTSHDRVKAPKSTASPPRHRLKNLRLPVLTVERSTPPSDPPSATDPKPPHSDLFRRRSFRPPLLRASSRTSYSAKSLTETASTTLNEIYPKPQSDTDLLKSASVAKAVEDKAGADAASASAGSEVPMSRRKIWVCRPGASPTLVQIQHDDLVDDVRDLIIRKYANSLGRSFDAPDITLRVIPREKGPSVGGERTLGPEEPMGATLEAYFPGGQAVDEALIIDIPRSKTPRISPRPPASHVGHYIADQRPLEDQDTGYFPPMPAGAINRRPPADTIVDVNGRADGNPTQPLPSPGERRLQQRPAMRRQHTSSPISNAGAATNSTYGHTHRATRQGTRGNTSAGQTPNPSLPTPPASEPPANITGQPVGSPANASPRLPASTKPKRSHKLSSNDQSQAPPPLHLGGLDGLLYADAVPPINVLIVEDNIINLKLLEMFVKRLKVRWASVMNGRDAVNKWREGGFHLVLMDIQLPIMSGLEATKEIRRLERVNGIGVFARSEGEARAPSPMKNGDYGANGERKDAQGDDKLTGMFKSPVIIVALTASSLQSDRHEALAAGCNDFLTKPVNFPWFERKILEWGCMQALIDFDGWRQWKELSTQIEANSKAAPPKKKKKKELNAEEQAERDAKKAALMGKVSSG